MGEQTFTLREQIGCIDRQINFQEQVIEVFHNESPSAVAEAKQELACLKSIRETLQNENLIEGICAAESAPWFEEITVC